MVRIDVTCNVTLADTAWSHGWTESPGRTHPVEYAAARTNGAGVWTWMTRFGGADLLSHPDARGGLDARLGASLTPRDHVSSRNHRE